MNKNFILIIFLILCIASFSFADSITNYVVPSGVNLDRMITATGIFAPTSGSAEDIKCSFSFYDANTGVLVKRATDQYTVGTGRFTALNIYASEPTFKRNYSYTLKTECGSASADANFLVLQRESFAEKGSNEFAFLTEPQNTDTGFIWGSIIVVLVIVCFVGIYLYKFARGR